MTSTGEPELKERDENKDSWRAVISEKEEGLNFGVSLVMLLEGESPNTAGQRPTCSLSIMLPVRS